MPLHRLAIGLFAALFASFLAWSLIAKVDIVVVAQGKLIPTTFVSIAQPPESGSLRRILVKDGDIVEAGQPLIEMDPVFAEEDSKVAALEVIRLTQQQARVAAELDGKTSVLADPAIAAELISRRAAYQAAVSEAENALFRARADLSTASARRAKATLLAPVAARQEDMLVRLKAVGFVSEAMYNDKLRDKLDTESETLIQQESARAAESAVAQATSALAKVKAEYRKGLMLERSDLNQRLAQAQAEQVKRAHRTEMTVIKAPVAGTVTGLTVHSPGQVVQAGAPLLSLVPRGAALRFEGWLRNEDSGQVLPGMASKVKLAAYPFQKFGWLEGELSWLGVDSETPESMRNAAGEPLFYRVRVTLPAQELRYEGTPLRLRPGQQATADVQVGTRTVFEYLTSPMRKVFLEAARER